MPGDAAWPAATLLGRLGSTARDALCAAGHHVRFPARKAVIRQGGDDRHVLLLLSGFVKVLAISESGYEALLGVRVGGELIGELSAIDGEPRSASVVTCGVVTARMIGSEELRQVSRLHSEVHIEISRMISSRLRWANRYRLDYRAHDAPTRVARVLVEIADRYGRRTDRGWELGVGLTQSELASLAGVALPTLEKALYTFDRATLTARVNRQTVLIDLPRLRDVAKMTEDNPY
jgi:CRP-like cAMP-binding protein